MKPHGTIIHCDSKEMAWARENLDVPSSAITHSESIGHGYGAAFHYFPHGCGGGEDQGIVVEWQPKVPPFKLQNTKRFEAVYRAALARFMEQVADHEQADMRVTSTTDWTTTTFT